MVLKRWGSSHCFAWLHQPIRSTLNNRHHHFLYSGLRGMELSFSWEMWSTRNCSLYHNLEPPIAERLGGIDGILWRGLGWSNKPIIDSPSSFRVLPLLLMILHVLYSDSRRKGWFLDLQMQEYWGLWVRGIRNCVPTLRNEANWLSTFLSHFDQVVPFHSSRLVYSLVFEIEGGRSRNSIRRCKSTGTIECLS